MDSCMLHFSVDSYELTSTLILLLGCLILFIASISAAFNDYFDACSWEHLTTWLFIVGGLLMIIGYIGYKAYAYYYPYARLD
jgi:hypothetical protein